MSPRGLFACAVIGALSSCSNGQGNVDGGAPSDAPSGCDLNKDPKDVPACIDESVGVFVSPAGSDSNEGSRAKPVQTISTALARLNGRPRVYVCEGVYTESVSIRASASIYGGLKCDWTVGGARPKFTGTKSDYVFAIVNVATRVAIYDVEVYGRDGAPNTGQQSGAIVADMAADISLSRMHIEAGNGGSGFTGTIAPFDFSTFSAGALKGADAQPCPTSPSRATIGV